MAQAPSRETRKVGNSLALFFLRQGIPGDRDSHARQGPAPEDHINAPPAGRHFLRSSPELHLKRLVAAGYERVFQIGPCFREGEIGRLHNEEFTMLEWYETGATYEQLMEFVKTLLPYVATQVNGAPRAAFNNNIMIDFEAEWLVTTVDKAFRHYGGVGAAEAAARDEFEIVLVEKVEPALPKDRPVILKDYPASMAALSRLKPDNPCVAERWELYLGGVEIANAYSELTDPVEQRRRFDAVSARRKAAGLPAYPVDEEFFAALARGLPDCAGCALGVDRLAMILCGAHSIDDVRSFRE